MLGYYKKRDNGLDAFNSNNIENALLKSKRLVISVTHKMRADILDKYDEIICIREGNIIEIGKFAVLNSGNQYFHRLCEDYRED